jgi:hypothetical protein
MGSDVFDHSARSGAVVGSGVPASETRNLPPFDGIELAGSNNVAIRLGREQSVVVHADDNLVARITTRVSGGKLVIGDEGGNFTTQSPMRIDVTVAALDELALTGSGTIVAAEVDAKGFSVTLSGSGVVRASGTTDSLEVELNGSGEAQLQDLVAPRRPRRRERLGPRPRECDRDPRRVGARKRRHRVHRRTDAGEEDGRRRRLRHARSVGFSHG